MKALVWDLDGTLLDSYDLIVRSTLDVMENHGLCDEYDNAYRILKQSSLGEYLSGITDDKALSAEMCSRTLLLCDERYRETVLMPGAEDALLKTYDAGIKHFVYTHKGTSAKDVLDYHGIGKYFTEVINITDGFPRKPAPDVLLYIAEKYGYVMSDVYYVGDRTLDVDFAKNAGAKAVLFLPEDTVTPNGKEDFIISALTDICKIVL